MVHGEEHFVTYLLAIHLFPSEVSFRSFAQYLSGLFVLLLLRWVPYTFWLLAPYQIHGLQIFSLNCWFVSLLYCLLYWSFFSLIHSHAYFCFNSLCFGGQIQAVFAQTMLWSISPCSFTVSVLTFKSLTHLVWFLYMMWDKCLISFFCLWILIFPSFSLNMVFLFLVLLLEISCP